MAFIIIVETFSLGQKLNSILRSNPDIHIQIFELWWPKGYSNDQTWHHLVVKEPTPKITIVLFLKYVIDRNNVMCNN